MGNILAPRQALVQTDALLFDDLNLTAQGQLGGGRFLTTLHCVTSGQHMVVKVYHKRNEHEHEFQRHNEELTRIKHSLSSRAESPNLIPFPFFHEGPKAAYLVRQYCATTISERVTTPPGLTLVEKQWLVFQMLTALTQCHGKNVCHGDVTLDNFVLTSFRWAYLTDFASFKPVLLRADNPSEFEYFFVSGEHKRCYIAPERFYDANPKETNDHRDAKLTPAMDIFSLGCAIAELYLDGATIFSFQENLAYKKGTFDINPRLARIPDQDIRKMVSHMLSLDPAARYSATTYLEQYGFPRAFQTLHTIQEHAINMSPDEKMRAIETHLQQVLEELEDDHNKHRIGATRPLEGRRRSVVDPSSPPTVAFLSLAGTRNSLSSATPTTPQNFSSTPPTTAILVEDSFSTEPQQQQNMEESSQILLARIENVRLRLAAPSLAQEAQDMGANSSVNGETTDAEQAVAEQSPQEPIEGVVLITTVIFSCIRHLRKPSSRILALDTLLYLSYRADDLVRMQRMVPYIKYLLGDSCAIVRARAVEVLAEVMQQVTTLVKGEANVFEEYLLPDLGDHITQEGDEVVLVACASKLSCFADLSIRFLSLSCEQQTLSLPKKHSTRAVSATDESEDVSLYDEKIHQLRGTVWKIFENLFNRDSSPVRRGLLQHMTPLCSFFGWTLTLNNVLPLIVSPLNMFTDWQYRSSFFENIAGLCLFLGRERTEDNILPCVFAELADPEEFVVQQVVVCLTTLCDLRLFPKHTVAQIAEMTAVLVCHPNNWIRYSTIVLFSTIGRVLDTVDTFALILPFLRPFLQQRVTNLDEETLLSTLKPPLSRHVFDKAVQSGLETSDGIVHSWSAEDENLLHVKATQQYLLRAHVASESFISSLRDRSQFQSELSNQRQHVTNSAKLFIAKSTYENKTKKHHDREQLVTALKLANPGNASLPSDASFSTATQTIHISEFSPRDLESTTTTTTTHGTTTTTTTTTTTRTIENPTTIPHTTATNSSFSSAFENYQNSTNNHDYSNSNTATTTAQHTTTFASHRRTNTTTTTTQYKPNSNNNSNNNSSANLNSLQSGNNSAAVLQNASNSLSVESISVQQRPRGLLYAQLMDHSRAVTKLCVAFNNSFFASASDDGTIKVWSPSHIAKHYTNRAPTATHSLPSPITCFALPAYSNTVACAAQSGDMQIFDIEVATEQNSNSNIANQGFTVSDPTHQRLTVSRCMNVATEGCALSMEYLNNSTLLFVTQQNVMRGWDTRSRHDVLEVPACPPLHMGTVQDMLVDSNGHWALLGTSLGFLVVYDLRYQVVSKAWRHPKRSCIVKLSHYYAPSSSSSSSVSSHFSSHVGPLVIVAARGPQSECCAVWDIGSGNCHASFHTVTNVTDSPKETLKLVECDVFVSGPVTFWKSQGPRKQIDDLGGEYQHFTGALCMPKNSSFLITAGTDRIVRLWDLSVAHQSYRIVSPPPDFRPGLTGVRPRNRPPSFSTQNLRGTKMFLEHPLPTNVIVAEDLPANKTQTSEEGVSVAHRGAITDVAIIKHGDSRWLLTSGRDGVIKVFR